MNAKWAETFLVHFMTVLFLHRAYLYFALPVQNEARRTSPLTYNSLADNYHSAQEQKLPSSVPGSVLQLRYLYVLPLPSHKPVNER